MNFYKYLSEFSPSELIQGIYLLESAVLKTARNGRNYIDLIIADKTGRLPGKIWNYDGSIEAMPIGSPVYLSGVVSEFQGSPQITCEELRPADDKDNIDKSRLIPVAPIDPDSAWSDITALVNSISDEDYRHMTVSLLKKYKEQFRTIPAAKSIHHAFLHGLLMHSRDMLIMADAAARQYADIVNRSLLLAGTVLHDIGKIQEYAFTDLGLASRFTISGALAGHLVLGAMNVRDIARDLNIPEEKSMLLQHMLLAHHGRPEFGAAIEPICPEAEILAMLDQIDAHMEMYRNAYKNTKPGSLTASRIYPLGRYLYRQTNTQQETQS